MPRRVASRWAAWEDQGGHHAAPGGASGGGKAVPGVPILNQQFPNGNVMLAFEFAWGADITKDPATWSWYDVSTDVQVDEGKRIVIQQGKLDARSTTGPAQLKFTLDNRRNRYSRSPFALNYPNVRRGVPVRCRVIYNQNPDASHILFQGRATVFQPTFDATGSYAVVNVTASGALRQLGQGNQALQSTMRQYTPAVSNLVAYWPMEDQASATTFAPVGGQENAAPMTSIGPTQFHSSTTIVSSDALPVFSNSSAVAWVPPYATTGAFQVRALAVWPASSSALPDQTIVMRLLASNGTIGRWDVVYGTGGSLKVLAYSATTGGLVFTFGPIAFNVDGTSGQLGISLTTSGADIAVQLSVFNIGGGPLYLNGTATSQTVGVLNQVQFMPFGVSQSITFGHLTVQNQASDLAENSSALNAYDGEYSYVRVSRLLGLVGMSASRAIGDGVSFPQRMGPQRIDTVLNLIRECEVTDAALVFDGHGDSLVFASHLNLENLTPALTVDARTQLMPTYPPVDDDQQLRNQWTVQQRNGSSAVYTDSSSPQGSSSVGLYPDSVTVNVNQNANGSNTGAFGTKALQNLASWFVHRDTPDGYRVPTVNLAFHRNPELLSSFVNNTTVSSFTRMDVSHLADVYPQLPPQTLQFLIVGYIHTLNQFTWDVQVNVVPYEPFHVGVVAQPSGDTGENVARPDTVSSQIGAEAPPGTASLLVFSADKGAWTTRADDFPFTISVAGIAITVTNITGASSPQTFTVDPTTVTKTLPAGSFVTLWNTPVLAIGATS